MILISYPAGGFGNFIYHILSEYSTNTYKVNNSNFKFDISGNSHSTQKYTLTYFHDPDDYQIVLPDTDKECLILCDNGINNDSYHKINRVFPGATIVRLCITNNVRPIIYSTCILKAMRSSLIKESQFHVNTFWTDSDEDFAVRENFTLLYHNWPFKWESAPNCINVSIESLILDPVSTLTNLIGQINGSVTDLNSLNTVCAEWQKSNKQYFEIYYHWKNINAALDNKSNLDISNITELHDQGYINYCIEQKFNVTIPAYNYRDWFKNTSEIKEMLECLK